jgi:hypothetical protein
MLEDQENRQEEKEDEPTRERERREGLKKRPPTSTRSSTSTSVTTQRTANNRDVMTYLLGVERDGRLGVPLLRIKGESEKRQEGVDGVCRS